LMMALELCRRMSLLPGNVADAFRDDVS
jgi:hypothetical protein